MRPKVPIKTLLVVLDDANPMGLGSRDLAQARASRSKPAEAFPPARYQNSPLLDRCGLFSLAPILRLSDSGDLRERLREAVVELVLTGSFGARPGSRRLHPETELT